MNFKVYQFNNYYNRILKYFETIEEYGEPIAEIESVSFNPNDNVSTTQIVNYDGTPIDYALLTDDDEIVSRWYVIEVQRVRGSQYKLTLYRDLLADFKDEVLSCDTFIEKGSLPANSALLYNSENFSVNQIKSEEKLLKDKLGCPWVVGYVAKNATKENLTANIKLEAEVTDALSINSTLEEWELYSAITYIDGVRTSNSLKNSPPSNFYYITDNARSRTGTPIIIKTNGVNGDGATTTSEGEQSLSYFNTIKGSPSSAPPKIQKAFQDYGLQKLETESYAYMPNVLTPDQWESLNKFRNTKIITSDNKLYQIEINLIPNIYYTTFNVAYSSSLGIHLASIYSDSGAFESFENNRDYKIKSYSTTVGVFVTRLYSDEYSVSIDTNRIKTEDSPYDIFCIPLGEVRVRNSDGVLLLNATRRDLAIPTAMALQKEGQNFIYDIQLLPYCPVPGLISYPAIGPGIQPEIKVPGDTYCTPIKKGDEIVSFVFHVSSSRFSFNINDSIILPSSNIEQKVVNQCDSYRLCSPNYSNYFDFNLCKNGSIRYFEVDCHYKPYTPYIHVVPQFGRLYGGDFNDPRGLILGGDFSLPQVGDAWRQYEINNKNFQQSFDRQIQSMELQHSMAEYMDKINIFTGTLQGVAGGASAAGIAGGSYAAIAGGIAGGAASLVGGLADLEINRRLRDDAKDLTKDQFGYQLENIKALPLTLSKVSPFTPNNKIFPVLEYYTCTQEEKTAFIKKIAYNGMTVGVIGHCEDYLADWSFDGIDNKHYIKGQIVRINLPEDFHLINTIANELNKGVYIE